MGPAWRWRPRCRPLRPGAGQYRRTVRLIVPTPAGGVYDLMGRLFIDQVGPRSAPPSSSTGAGGNATSASPPAALAAPDGYTLLLGSNSTHIVQPAMMRNPPYDPVKQFALISTLSASWGCIVVAPKLGINTVAELIEHPRRTRAGSTSGMRGIGDGSHIRAEMFKQLTPASRYSISPTARWRRRPAT